ncbi:MAG TPA: SUMF1/EgtB/PvdO family nonheme iron enzyme [Phycisphaerae bacterium]|nr:SUMF1/EgtB/PvdO family nonheme iron enzyme [Phycisphaerae bacterium]HNU46191.1 SUMF1/EgtB/PvdO family nonheme iron enzyme [Phycisphaerae bacterium]
MGLKLFSRKSESTCPAPSPLAPVARSEYDPAGAVALAEDPVARALQLERYGLLLREPQRWAGSPGADEALRAAGRAVDDQFALVPDGFVALPQSVYDYPGAPELDCETPAFLLAKYAVTNAQFQKFVDAGGYEELELWPQDVWPHLIDFKDQTEQPGPRFWRRGRHDRRRADHPVVGVSHYEASAYAQWAGYRLPTEAEWQMAASWRIRSSAHVWRRYPWGDALELRRCNLWASSVGDTVPVTGYPQGAAPNGVLQLVGNVWEWTASDFAVIDENGQPVVGDMLMKAVRGGAFDTYFPAQATSAFRTGVACLIRAHNVGFRCALDLQTRQGEAG